MDISEVQENIARIKKERRRGSESEYDEEEDVEQELDLDEFISFISKEMLDNEVKEELVEAYRKFSGSDNLEQGFSRKQLQETMQDYGEKRMTNEEFNLLFEETDADGDGLINFDDFVRMMMSR